MPPQNRKKTFFEITRGRRAGPMHVNPYNRPLITNSSNQRRHSITSSAATATPAISAAAITVSKFSREGSLKRLQGYRSILTQVLDNRGTPSKSDQQVLINHLLKLSTYGFEYPDEFETSQISVPVERLCDSSPERFGKTTVSMAQELRERWKTGDFRKRMLETLPEPDPTPEPEDYYYQSGPNSDSNSDSDSEGDVIDIDDHNNDGFFKDRDMSLEYGLMLRGIVRRWGNNKQYLTIADGVQRPSNVFGHNDIPVGTWWPMQVCARRDGAHGAPVAGIYGQVSEGAFSIVSSGGIGYEDSDKDWGNELLYSGSNGHNRKGDAVTLVTTNDTMKLMRSHEQKKPVRVIRGKGASKWAPSVGLRYDGLYMIESYDTAWRKVPNGKAGQQEEFWQFKMVRCEGQEPLESIIERSPTMEEKGAYLTYRKSY
ncbi:PUA-like domain-containing protein [Trichophaea hybrida]|nr:PUA-like domain-containing protein [Trichophaea hybrida]